MSSPCGFWSQVEWCTIFQRIRIYHASQLLWISCGFSFQAQDETTGSPAERAAVPVIHGGTDEADDLLRRVGQTLAKNAMRHDEERQREGRSPKQSYSFLVSRGLFLKGGRFFVRGDVSFVCLQRQRGRINIIHVSVRSGSSSSRSGSVVVLRMANAITLTAVWLVLVVCLGDHRSDECSLTGNLVRLNGNL